MRDSIGGSEKFAASSEIDVGQTDAWLLNRIEHIEKAVLAGRQYIKAKGILIPHFPSFSNLDPD